jgi:hypothetical protein
MCFPLPIKSAMIQGASRDLKVFKLQSDEFSPPQTGSEQYDQYGAVAFGAQRFDNRPLHQRLCLFGGEPVPNANAQTLSSFYTPNSSRQIGTEEGRVSGLPAANMGSADSRERRFRANFRIDDPRAPRATGGKSPRQLSRVG